MSEIQDLKIELAKTPQLLLQENLLLVKEVSPKSNIADTSSMEFILANISARVNYGINKIIDRIINFIFTQTAKGSDLDFLIFDRTSLERKPPSVAGGNVNVEGLLGYQVDVGTIFTYAGNSYVTLASETIAVQNFVLASAIYDALSQTVTAITDVEHGLASGITGGISGFNESDYNVSDVIITIIDGYTFTYPKTGILVSPATGSGNLEVSIAKIEIESLLTGASQNISNQAEMDTEDDNLTGVFIDYGNISNGSDIENDENYYSRYLLKLQSILGNHSEDLIEQYVLEVSGVTRAKILSATPNAGYFTVYFMRDNDLNPIPSLSAINEVKEYLIDPIRFDPTKETDRVIVAAPIPEYHTITISSPSITSKMQDALNGSLASLFYAADIGGGLTRNKIITTIQTTEDIDNNKMPDFDLISPATDITVASNSVLVYQGLNIV